MGAEHVPDIISEIGNQESRDMEEWKMIKIAKKNEKFKKIVILVRNALKTIFLKIWRIWKNYEV